MGTQVRILLQPLSIEIMKATKEQKQIIHINQPDKELKEMMVQQATGDLSKISCNDLNFDQANMIIVGLGKQPKIARKEDSPAYWGHFNNSKKQHKQILSILYQLKWTKPHTRFGIVPHTERFGNWLQSPKSPVKKPLQKMTPEETTTIINALNGILKSLYK